jgi:hypothetical protein
VLLAGLWLGGVAGGFAAWEAYDAKPGQQAGGAAPPAGPAWTLTFYAHPHCPCTRAGLAELAELARDAPQLDVTVVFVRPAGAEPGWERSAAWDAVPGAHVRCDAGGAEAARVGALTSGQAVLTDHTGRVAFRGGLTRGRGRVGESPGRRAVLAILRGEEAPDAAPVYGCPLADEQ